jgi:hypothetical protein
MIIKLVKLILFVMIFFFPIFIAVKTEVDAMEYPRSNINIGSFISSSVNQRRSFKDKLFPTPTIEIVCPAVVCGVDKIFKPPCSCVDPFILSSTPTISYPICAIACPIGTVLQPPCRCVPNPIISSTPISPKPFMCMRVCPINTILTDNCQCIPHKLDITVLE